MYIFFIIFRFSVIRYLNFVIWLQTSVNNMEVPSSTSSRFTHIHITSYSHVTCLYSLYHWTYHPQFHLCPSPHSCIGNNSLFHLSESNSPQHYSLRTRPLHNNIASSSPFSLLLFSATYISNKPSSPYHHLPPCYQAPSPPPWMASHSNRSIIALLIPIVASVYLTGKLFIYPPHYSLRP